MGKDCIVKGLKDKVILCCPGTFIQVRILAYLSLFGGLVRILISYMLLAFALFGQTVMAEDSSFYPSNILMLDDKFAHHVILVEKSTHTLYLYENDKTFPKLVKSFPIASGKARGDKSSEGDHRTPEGIYTIYEFLSKEELLRRHGSYAKIYGSGAFPMDYPNFMDTLEKKTGSGIWLHSTDDDSRVFNGLDSRGCVVVQNADLKEISKYIELDRTPIIVVQDIFFLSKSSWTRNRKELNETILKWGEAWQNKNFNDYISHYDENQFFDRSKGGFNSYKNYKRAVFSRADAWNIQFQFLSIMATSDYAVVQLQQDYKSSIINDIGKKTLYLKKNKNYEWKIVGELFTKDGVESNLASFTPSMRFFKE